MIVTACFEILWDTLVSITPFYKWVGAKKRLSITPFWLQRDLVPVFKQKTDVSFAQVHCFNALTIVVTINEHGTVMTFKNHFIVAIYDGHFIPKLTHLPLVPHICVSVNWVSVGSDNGLSPVRHQAITWTNGELWLIGPLWTKLQWNLDQNIKFFVHEKTLKDGGHFVQGEMT